MSAFSEVGLSLVGSSWHATTVIQTGYRSSAEEDVLLPVLALLGSEDRGFDGGGELDDGDLDGEVP